MDCKKQFNARKTKKITTKDKRLFHAYVHKKQTYRELAHASGKNRKTLAKKFKTLNPKVHYAPIQHERVWVVFDGTFFRNICLLLFRTRDGWGEHNPRSSHKRYGRNLCWRFINWETIENISTCLDILDVICPKWYASFTLDGRRWVIQLLERRYPWIPIQYCLFHQMQTIERYTTKKPKTECGKHLREIITSLAATHKTIFQIRFRVWDFLWHEYLLERNDKGGFMHRRLRSARWSLRRNMKYLFTYQNHPHLTIETTTNTCDWYFSHLKQKVHIHRWISYENKQKIIELLLSENT